MQNNNLDLSQQTAIITGGAGLLGKVYVSALLECGAKVIVIDKKINKKKILAELKNEKIQNLTLVECDITKESEVKKTFFSLRNKLNDLKILINNASLVTQVGKGELESTYKPFLKMKKTDWEQYFDVDLSGTMLVSQNVIPFFQKNGGGSIVNISSTYGLVAPDQRIYGVSGQNAAAFYSATKAAIINLTRYLASYWNRTGIRVNSLSPGGVENSQEANFIKNYSEKTILGRMAQKDEYIGSIIFLSSDASSYMTGSNLIVDGGWTAW